MKKLLYIIGWLVFFTPMVQAGEYEGIWENITDKNSCNLGKIKIDDSYSYFKDQVVRRGPHGERYDLYYDKLN